MLISFDHIITVLLLAIFSCSCYNLCNLIIIQYITTLKSQSSPRIYIKIHKLIHFIVLFYNHFFILKILKRLYIFIFRERGGEGKEQERERNITVWLPLVYLLLGTWPEIQVCALTGNRTGDPLVHKSAFNPLSHTSQGRNYFLKFLRLGLPPKMEAQVDTLCLFAQPKEGQ